MLDSDSCTAGRCSYGYNLVELQLTPGRGVESSPEELDNSASPSPLDFRVVMFISNYKGCMYNCLGRLFIKC